MQCDFQRVGRPTARAAEETSHGVRWASAPQDLDPATRNV